MKKICIVTATRAEYGILKPLILKLMADSRWETQLIVTGSHLSELLGNTCQEIEQDGLQIYEKIPILAEGDSPYDTSVTMANALLGFGTYFRKERPDMLIVLGDRTELIGICGAAMNERIPIAHLHGGELTQGAVDDCVRHAVTKMSYLHFASAEEYRRRIIQMGEEPERVYNVGALGVENILKEKLLDRDTLKREVDFPADRDYAVVTFHPVTLEGDPKAQLKELLAAMRERTELFFLITKANADAGGRLINEILKTEAAKSPNMKLVSSLGMRRYLSAVKHARFVLGNSSSGIIEAPSLGVPTVNIGDRQKGRIMAESVIQCAPEHEAIRDAMEKAMEWHEKQFEYASPYGCGDTSDRIIQILQEYLGRDTIDVKKKFYDISW